MTLRTLGIRQQRTVLLKRWETNEVSTMIAQLTVWWKCLGGSTGRRSPSRAQKSPWVEEKELESLGSQGSQSSHGRVPENQELHRKKAPEIYIWSLQVLNWVHTWEEKHGGQGKHEGKAQGKSHAKRIEGTVFRPKSSLEIGLISNS